MVLFYGFQLLEVLILVGARLLADPITTASTVPACPAQAGWHRGVPGSDVWRHLGQRLAAPPLFRTDQLANWHCHCRWWHRGRGLGVSGSEPEVAD